jgi:hypothetical protein
MTRRRLIFLWGDALFVGLEDEHDVFNGDLDAQGFKDALDIPVGKVLPMGELPCQAASFDFEETFLETIEFLLMLHPTSQQVAVFAR